MANEHVLNLEAYAKVLARLACRGGADAEEVLSDLGMSLDEFHRAEPKLRRELVDAYRDGAAESAMQFATAMGQELVTQGPLNLGAPTIATPPRSAVEASIPTWTQKLVRAPPDFDDLPPTAKRQPFATTLPAGDYSALLPASARALLQTPDGGAGDAKSASGDCSAPAPTSAPAVTPGSLPPTASAPTVTPPSAPPVAPASAPVIAPASAPAPASPARESQLGSTDAYRSGLRGFASPWGSPLQAREEDSDGLSLEAYAGITSALARGEPRAQVLGALGLNDESFHAAATGWAVRFECDPSLGAVFKELVRQKLGR